MGIDDEKILFSDLLTHINDENIEASKTLLEEFGLFRSEIQNKTLYEISLKSDAFLYDVLDFLTELQIDDKDLANKIYDLVLEKSHSNTVFLEIFLSKGSGERLKTAAPFLASILTNETNEKILSETIRALGKIREKSCVDVIADFIFYGHVELKRIAIEALASIETREAMEKLTLACNTSKADPYMKETLEKLKISLSGKKNVADLKVEQLASKKDTFDEMREDSDLAQLLSMFNSTVIIDRHLSLELLNEMGAKAIPALSENMDMEDSDSVVHTLDILGYIGSDTAIKTIMEVIQVHPQDSSIKIAAYQAIQRIPSCISLLSILEGLNDDTEQVRMAAAIAINQNCSEVLIDGLKSRFEENKNEFNKEAAVAAIIDTCADNIFTGLLESNAFMSFASEYLQSTPLLITRHFIKILEDKGFEILAATIEDCYAGAGESRSFSVYVVDSSIIMHRIYSKFLLERGYNPVFFEDPLELIETIKIKKPDYLIVDLFVINMSGIEVVEEVRKNFDKSELPVAVAVPSVFLDKIKVQNDDRSGGLAKIRNIGANFILAKPFSAFELEKIFSLKE